MCINFPETGPRMLMWFFLIRWDYAWEVCGRSTYTIYKMFQRTTVEPTEYVFIGKDILDNIRCTVSC